MAYCITGWDYLENSSCQEIQPTGSPYNLYQLTRYSSAAEYRSKGNHRLSQQDLPNRKAAIKTFDIKNYKSMVHRAAPRPVSVNNLLNLKVDKENMCKTNLLSHYDLRKPARKQMLQSCQSPKMAVVNICDKTKFKRSELEEKQTKMQQFIRTLHSKSLKVQNKNKRRIYGKNKQNKQQSNRQMFYRTIIWKKQYNSGPSTIRSNERKRALAHNLEDNYHLNSQEQ